MELSQFDKTFKATINELNFISGRAFVLESFLRQTKEHIDNDSRIGSELMTAGLAFRDITLNKDVDNLFMSSEYYQLNRLNLKEETDMILSRECLFYISQAYEALESYLYDQVAEFIRVNNTFNLFVDIKDNTSTFSSIRKGIKSLDDRKNNRHLLRILRSNSKAFATYETNNIYDLDFQAWFEMISEVRHCITHKRMVLSDDILNMLSPTFHLFFEHKEYNHERILFINYQNCSELIRRISDYVFFVYKSVVESSSSTKVNFSLISQYWPPYI